MGRGDAFFAAARKYPKKAAFLWRRLMVLFAGFLLFIQ
jgi:hypothetical protein